MNTSSQNQTPWFGVSLGLFGIILGYAIGTAGIFGGANMRLAADLPSVPSSVPAPPDAPAAKPIPPVDVVVDHLRGDPQARITVVEYSDYECPFCKRHHPTIVRLLDEYPDDMNWVYRHFPLSSIHPQAQPAAEAAECAGSLGGNDAFWEYSDALFNAPQLTNETYTMLAKTVGLDEVTLRNCIASGRFLQKISGMQNAALDAGVQGTPANFLIDHETGKITSLEGAVPFESFQSAIDTILKS